ncbi:MAG: NDP-sugar synthase [Deltaproteobacteria bacterium]|nr:NDP-sugar synthase [Deltaproteobacteria bacterium]
MKALILAAGLGTRMKGLTEKRPKALMPIANRPVIARNIEYLMSFGVRHFAVNAHHHHVQIVEYLNGGIPFGVEIDVRVEKDILGTGGAIKNFSDFFGDDPFIVLNADILTDIDLEKAYNCHVNSGKIATMILHDYEPFNQIMIRDSHIIDISRQKSPERLAFTGIHIISPDILSYMPESGYSDIIDCYNRLIRSGKAIGAYVSERHYWRDIGTPESYIAANRERLEFENRSFIVGHDSEIALSASFTGWAAAGRGAVLEDGVEVKRSILWDNVTVKKGVKITDSVVTSLKVIDHDLMKEIL